MKDNLITVNSISGGKTSAYVMAHYPANINIFALVRVEDKANLWMKGKDEKTRQLVSDKIGKEFIGTVEMDEIIYTILEEVNGLAYKLWEPLETYWIEQFRQWGFEVVNKRKKGGSGPEFRLEGTWGSHYIRAYCNNFNIVII